MAGTADQMKGKTKEAVGDLTGNDDLKSEGKADRQAGEAKEKVARSRRRSKRGSIRPRRCFTPSSSLPPKLK